MPTLPDYSEFLTPERLVIEEDAWRTSGLYMQSALAIYRCVADFMSFEGQAISVLEIGCGTGWVPTVLPFWVTPYSGMDKNPECLELAEAKNLNCGRYRAFSMIDVRALREGLLSPFDIVCAFAFLKHFALDEWNSILGKILICGDHGVFSTPIGLEDQDNGEQYGFHHVTVTQARLEEAVRTARHSILRQEIQPTGETMVWTRRA